MRYYVEVTESEAKEIEQAGGQVQMGASGHGNRPRFPGRTTDEWMLLYSKDLLDELDGHQFKGGPKNGHWFDSQGEEHSISGGA